MSDRPSEEWLDEHRRWLAGKCSPDDLPLLPAVVMSYVRNFVAEIDALAQERDVLLAENKCLRETCDEIMVALVRGDER